MTPNFYLNALAGRDSIVGLHFKFFNLLACYRSDLINLIFVLIIYFAWAHHWACSYASEASNFPEVKMGYTIISFL